MKDYYNDKVEFIEGYVLLENEEIGVTYADGTYWTLPYSENTVENIKKIMENQASVLLIKKKKTKRTGTINMINLAVVTIGAAYGNYILGDYFGTNHYMYLVANILASPIYYKTVKNVIVNKLQINEIEKVEIFAENGNDINERAKENYNILGKYARKLNTPSGKLNINNYDTLSLVELKHIKNNLDRDRSLLLDSNQNSEIDKGRAKELRR